LSLDTDIAGLEPTSFKKAAQDPKWPEAMTEEYDALLTIDTWELVSPQSGHNLVGCKWVY